MDKQDQQQCKCEELQQKLQEAELKAAEFENNWKRALADYKNFEKRVSEEKETILKMASESVISRLLPVLDNMQMLEKHLDDMGLKLTVKEFLTALKDLGIEEINPLNETFSPATMEAIELVVGEENKIIEVTTKGYKLNGRLLRPAKVKVGKAEISEADA